MSRVSRSQRVIRKPTIASDTITANMAKPLSRPETEASTGLWADAFGAEGAGAGLAAAAGAAACMARAAGAASCAACCGTGGAVAAGGGWGGDGIFMLGAAVGLGGKVMRTVSFLG